MWILLDILVLAIVFVYVLICMRRGFIRTAIELVGFCLAIYLSFTISGALSESIYVNTIEPAIVKSVVTSVGETATGSVNQTVQSVWDSLPDFVTKSAKNFGVSSGSLAGTISTQVANSSGTQEIAKAAASSVVRPIVVPLLKTVISLIIFLILMFLVKILARVVNKAFSIPLIGSVNRLLGGVLGFGKGVVVAAVVCIVLSTLARIMSNGLWIFTTENIDRSHLFGLLASLNPLMN